MARSKARPGQVARLLDEVEGPLTGCHGLAQSAAAPLVLPQGGQHRAEQGRVPVRLGRGQRQVRRPVGLVQPPAQPEDAGPQRVHPGQQPLPRFPGHPQRGGQGLLGGRMGVLVTPLDTAQHRLGQVVAGGRFRWGVRRHRVRRQHLPTGVGQAGAAQGIGEPGGREHGVLVVAAPDELVEREAQDLGSLAEVAHAAQHLAVGEAGAGGVHVEPRDQVAVVAVGGVVGEEGGGPCCGPAQVFGGAWVVGAREVGGEGVDGVGATAEDRLCERAVQLPAADGGEPLIAGEADQRVAEGQPRLVLPAHHDVPLLDERGGHGSLQRIGGGTPGHSGVQPVRGDVEQL
ncbi:hypothetical protein [Streptomyces sp. WAC 04229]|uniref:hypothetical protein n=1 Tax=Streptomyces sp. WAC 04229 TaxID=2203206 RepID=UPI0021AE02BE|nr:hypothetical protein [Streptomyces sp. WAC 04229]